MNFVEQAQYELARYNTRRHFLRQCTAGLGSMALGSLLGCDSPAAKAVTPSEASTLALTPHFAPRAKRVIFLAHGWGPVATGAF